MTRQLQKRRVQINDVMDDGKPRVVGASVLLTLLSDKGRVNRLGELPSLVGVDQAQQHEVTVVLVGVSQ